MSFKTFKSPKSTAHEDVVMIPYGYSWYAPAGKLGTFQNRQGPETSTINVKRKQSFTHTRKVIQLTQTTNPSSENLTKEIEESASEHTLRSIPIVVELPSYTPTPATINAQSTTHKTVTTQEYLDLFHGPVSLSKECIEFNVSLINQAKNLSTEMTINASENLFVGDQLPPIHYSARSLTSYSQVTPIPLDYVPTMIDNTAVVLDLPITTQEEQLFDTLKESLQQGVSYGKRAWHRNKGLLAQGGMSSIYTYHDTHLLRTMAMKCPKKHDMNIKYRLLFIKEALVTGQLEHPNIPPIYDLWIDETEEVCFTMKKVKGKTFTHLVHDTLMKKGRERKALEPLIDILLKVCDALSYAHENGVYHRDIKPDNVMVGNHGEVLLMDWGCSLINDQHGEHLVFPEGLLACTQETVNTTVGTISYMSPEQARGEKYLMGACSDVYLMGGMLYFLLTGQAPRPRHKSRKEHLKLAQCGYIVPPYIHVPYEKLPQKLCLIAKKALHPDPQQRYASILEFKEALKQAIQEGWWFRTIHIPKDKILFEEGDEGYTAYMIIKGSCEVYHVRDHKLHSLAIIGPGQVFGETAIFGNMARTASVRVLEDLTVLEVTREAFNQELIEGSWLQIFVKTLANRFKKLEQNHYENKRKQ